MIGSLIKKGGFLTAIVACISLMLAISSCKTTEEIQPEPIPSEEIVDVKEIDPEEIKEVETIEEIEEERSGIPEPPVIEEVEESDYIMVSDAESPTPPAPTAMRAEMAMSKSRTASSGKLIISGSGAQAEIKAGQITAGEWNHLDKWDKWKELLENKDYNEMQEHWKIFPRSRYSVFVRNQYELPLQDARVDLINEEKEIVWTARTDNSGKAELWADINSQQKSGNSYKAVVTIDGKKHTIDNLQDIEGGVNNLDLNVACSSAKNVDIMWAVDATGSMGDEIQYLQTELEDVISRSLKGEKLNIRTGSVFYRDTKDDYLTRVQPLGADQNKTLEFIKEQGADGGGDYPEAVESALEDCLAQEWSENAIARIIFLMLDAPPHHNPEVLAQLQEQIKEAAERGIKIIPVTASGINRQTEFLMKFMAIATNGTYVFITDHSGIGNPHLKPVVQDFEVEKLNDLLVRLLYHYTKSNGCDANETASAKGSEFKLFPNPTSNYVTITSPSGLTSIKVLSNSGRTVITKTDISEEEVRLELEGLVDGIYTVQCLGEGFKSSQPLIIVNGY